MRNSDEKLVDRFRTAPSNAAAVRRFAAYYQRAIFSAGLDLPDAFFQAEIREPWKTLAGTHRIWAWIGEDGFYRFAEDRNMTCFDPVVRAGLEMLGLGGYDVIRALREDFATHPEFWCWDWQGQMLTTPDGGNPAQPVDQSAIAVLDSYRRYWLRFWSKTWNLEDRLGEFLRRSRRPQRPAGTPARKRAAALSA